MLFMTLFLAFISNSYVLPLDFDSLFFYISDNRPLTNLIKGCLSSYWILNLISSPGNQMRIKLIG